MRPQKPLGAHVTAHLAARVSSGLVVVALTVLAAAGLQSTPRTDAGPRSSSVTPSIDTAQVPPAAPSPTTTLSPSAWSGIRRAYDRRRSQDTGAQNRVPIVRLAQQAYLKASFSGGEDQFGWSVAVSGDTAVVGAPGESSDATGIDGDQASDAAPSSGAAYVFVRSGGVWSQQAYLKASTTDIDDRFGYSVAVSGDTVVISARGEDSAATGVGGNQGDNGAEDAGAAYVFVRNDGVWSQQAYLKASNTDGNDLFGWSVAVSGDTVVVGAFGEDGDAMGVNADQGSDSAEDAGAAYVFVRNGDRWSQQAYLKASNAGAGDQFGWSVAVSGDMVVAGAPAEDSNATGVNGAQDSNMLSSAGAAYVFVRSLGVWSQQAYLKASNTDAEDRPNDLFGVSVAVSGDTVVVGAIGEDSGAMAVNGPEADNSASNAGAAYVFVRREADWFQQAYLKASNTGTTQNDPFGWNDLFGWSVAVSGDTVVVGAIGEDSSATGVDGNARDNSASGAGAAYVFARGGGVWRQQGYLKASNTNALDQFGRSVTVSEDTVVVGAYGEDSSATGIGAAEADEDAAGSGATYLFERSGAAGPNQAATR